jgi:ABC-type dipeptide/oligopeptide/nickel transport system permease subunit
VIAVVIVGVEIGVVVGFLMGVVNSYFEEKLFDQVLQKRKKKRM